MYTLSQETKITDGQTNGRMVGQISDERTDGRTDIGRTDRQHVSSIPLYYVWPCVCSTQVFKTNDKRNICV